MIKNYKEFILEKLDSNNFTTELEIDGITDKEILLINKLKEICKKSDIGEEADHYIFFENPIVVGKRSGKDVICNFYYVHDNSFYGMNYLVFNIIYNERKDPKNIYDKINDFSYINYYDIKRGIHARSPYKNGQFGKPVNMRFQFNDNFLEKIYNSASKLSDNWIKKCDEVRKESRDWSRMCNNPKGCPNIDWERQLYHVKCQIFYHKILQNQEDLTSIRMLKEMETDGEEVYKEKMRKQNEIMKELMDDWLKTKK